MKKRKGIALQLPAQSQALWAKKCIKKAAYQQRNLFYIMASMWLSEIELSLIGST
jgi:hypothetical protein